MEHAQSAISPPQSSEEAFSQIATAPGDLPTPQQQLRLTSQTHQFRHDNTIVPLAPEPEKPVEVWATSGTGMPLHRAAIFYTTDGSLPTLDSQSLPMTEETVDWQVSVGYLTRWRAEIPGQAADTVVRYRIGGWQTGEPDGAEPTVWAHDGQGFHFADPNAVTVFAYSVETARSPLPHWMADAVIYQIFLDRFHPGTEDGRFTGPSGPRDRHGGTIDGVRQALPYLADLGVTCLWLSPLHPSETYHRYDTIDFFHVDPELGGNKALLALVNEAHAREMRVLLDFVPSHASWHHPAFLAAQQDRTSPTHSWFTFDEWPDKYRSFLGVSTHLPTFNTQDEGAREYLIGSAVHWLEEYGVDGFRVDHVIGPSMDFWVAFHRAITQAKADVVAFGEATDTPDSLRRYRGRLHGILDFPLARALRSTFAAGTWGVGELDSFLDAHETYMESGPGRVSFLDNHDMERFLYLAGGDTARLKLAALCLFTLSATPILYYGTEVGLSHSKGFGNGLGGDSEARRDMIWDTGEWDRDLLVFFQGLIRLRRDYPALQHRSRRTTHLDRRDQTYAYLRSRHTAESVGTDDLLVAFNLGNEAASIPLPDGNWSTVLFSKDRLNVASEEVHLPPHSGAMLRREMSRSYMT